MVRIDCKASILWHNQLSEAELHLVLGVTLNLVCLMMMSLDVTTLGLGEDLKEKQKISKEFWKYKLQNRKRESFPI